MEKLTTVTLETSIGIDIEQNFTTGERVRRFHGYAQISEGRAHVILEVRG